MPTLQFTTKYKKNTNLMLSPTELRVLYFYGIDIKSKDGTKFSDATFEMHIRQAQKEVEEYLEIKLFPELITETQSYYRDSYFNGFPLIQTKYPVARPYTLNGLLGKTQQIEYPETWLQSKTSNNENYARRVSIVPTGSTTAASGDVILSGVTFQVGIQSFSNIPDYWTIQYKTGFDTIQKDLLQLVGMMASISYLSIAGDFALPPGVASQSLSIDGLSQSVSSTASATSNAFAARVKMYRDSIKPLIERIKSKYVGIRFTSM